MKRAVVFAGAGLSKPFGLPLLGDIFKDAAVRAFLDSTPELRIFLEETVWAKHGLNIDSSERGPNLEQIYDELQIDGMFGESTAYGTSRVESIKLRDQLRTLAYHAVYVGKSSRSWGGLNSLIVDLEDSYDLLVWATFNWDCLFESCYAQCRRVHRGSPYRNPRLILNLEKYRKPIDSKTTYLKLHGGINWWAEEGTGLCEYIQYGKPENDDLNVRWNRLLVGKDGSYPLMLHPSPDKYNDDNPAFSQLLEQWHYLFDEAQDWSNTDVYFLGYSCPSTDRRARRLLLNLNKRAPNSILVHYFSKEDKDRFYSVFGDQADYCQMDFLDYDVNAASLLSQLRLRKDRVTIDDGNLFDDA